MVSLNLGIPDSHNTVSVKIIDSSSLVIPASIVFSPVHPDYPSHPIPVYCFLIEHAPTGKRILFDLGIRMNPKVTSPPATQEFLDSPGMGFVVEKDVATQLTEGGVPLESINAIIWSHAHFDHIGTPTTFPLSTDLVVGPGFTSDVLPPYPARPDSTLFEEDIAGRKLVEISFEDSPQTIAGLRAHDYFGDGSFYLLDTPGHFPGHVVGLARVTTGPRPTFIVMGADICHHPGQLRPSHAHSYPSSLLSRARSLGIEENKAPLNITLEGNIHYKPLKAIESLEKLQFLDGEEDVFVVLAHDSSLKGTVNLFPKEANSWKAEGWKEKTAWAFLEEGNSAYRFTATS